MATPAANPNLGDVLGDGQEIFRAFAEKGHRKRRKTPPHEVRYFAYLLREEDVADGLSVGLRPSDAVKHLAENFGYCSISTGVVHFLPYGLVVRLDAADPNHGFICNLPLMSISDQSRELAVLIARELARKSICVTCDPYKPNGCATN